MFARRGELIGRGPDGRLYLELMGPRLPARYDIRSASATLTAASSKPLHSIISPERPAAKVKDVMETTDLSHLCRLVSVALAGLLLAPSALRAQDVSGFVEVRASDAVGVEGKSWQTIERYRPSVEVVLAPRARLLTTLEVAFLQGRDTQEELQRTLEESDFGPLFELAQCTWPERSHEVLGFEDGDAYLDVSRFHLDVYLPSLDLRVGRQALHWGSAQLINPTDPFPELFFAEPWRPRRGVYAARATVPLSQSGDFTGVVATNDDWDALRTAARLRLSYGQTDLALVAAYRSDGGVDGDGIVGIDVRGTLGVGYWLEAALHLRETEYEEIAFGIDYSFAVRDGLIVTGEYYRNGAGDSQSDPASAGLGPGVEPPDCRCDLESLGLFAADGGDDPFAPLLSGRDYLLLAAYLSFSPAVSTSLSALQNLGDGTGSFAPSITIRPRGWLDVSVTAQIPYKLWGDGGELKPAADDFKIVRDLGTLGVFQADLSGMVPDASITVWTRASF